MSEAPLHMLCIEPRFPGRLGGVADWLVRHRGYRCWFYCHSVDERVSWPSSVGRGLTVVPFNVGGVARERSVHWTRQLERGLCYAYGCWEVLEANRPRPLDLILGRSAGLGSTLFAPVFAPRVPIVNLFDYYYHARDNDLAQGDADLPIEYFQWRRSAVAMDLLELENGVIPWVATRWQRNLYPKEYRSDFHLLFDGLDVRTQWRQTNGERRIGGRAIPSGMKVVSYVARSLDRTRGFDRFVELASRLIQERSDVLCIAIGNPVVHRGLDVPYYGKDYRAILLERIPLSDPARLWCLGGVSPAVVSELLGQSDLHVYPSRPYPISRSVLDAMAAGCVVLASDTEPAREFIDHERTGLLVDPADGDGWVRRAMSVLGSDRFRPLGAAASESMREQYSRDVTLPKLASLLCQAL